MNREADEQGRAAEGTPVAGRSSRPLSAPVLTFDLAQEADRLRAEPPWSQHGSNAVTLVKHADLRILLILLKKAARQRPHHAGARISIMTLSGHVRLHLNDTTVDLPAGHLLALESGIDHDLEAVEESAVLLTLAWRGE